MLGSRMNKDQFEYLFPKNNDIQDVWTITYHIDTLIGPSKLQYQDIMFLYTNFCEANYDTFWKPYNTLNKKEQNNFIKYIKNSASGAFRYNW